jgi:hypothetical protein
MPTKMLRPSKPLPIAIEAKRNGNPRIFLSRFHNLIASKADGLKERFGCDRVRFSVVVESGHVSFKAKADRGEVG